MSIHLILGPFCCGGPWSFRPILHRAPARSSWRDHHPLDQGVKI